MIKRISLAMIVVFFAACSAPTQPKAAPKSTPKKVASTPVKKKQMHHKHMDKKMAHLFQSVSKDKAILVQSGKNKSSCVICGMNLPKFYKTNYMATNEGKAVQYCSIHCLADHLSQGAELKNPKVVDVTSLKFIPVLDAYYVVGSNVRGTMSHVSKYAFASLDDAKAFQKEHGGKIMDFSGALKTAKEDFK